MNKPHEPHAIRTVTEIAEITGRSKQSVQQGLHRAKKKIKIAIGDDRNLAALVADLFDCTTEELIDETWE